MPRIYSSGDLNRDIANYYSDLDREMKAYPKCACCGEHVMQESAVRVWGRWICDTCLEENRRETVDY